jgi:hypothetical protein
MYNKKHQNTDMDDDGNDDLSVKKIMYKKINKKVFKIMPNFEII